MTVKISYTIDIDETPEEVAKLLKDTNEKLRNISNDILNASTVLEVEGNCMRSYEKISEARTKFSKIDAALLDATTILIGYQQALIAQETQNIVQQSEQVPTAEEGEKAAEVIENESY